MHHRYLFDRATFPFTRRTFATVLMLLDGAEGRRHISKKLGTLYFTDTNMKTPGVHLIQSTSVKINLKKQVHLLASWFQALGIYLSIPTKVPQIA